MKRKKRLKLKALQIDQKDLKGNCEKIEERKICEGFSLSFIQGIKRFSYFS